jgi:hypothetical protein
MFDHHNTSTRGHVSVNVVSGYIQLFCFLKNKNRHGHVSVHVVSGVCFGVSKYNLNSNCRNGMDVMQ